MAVFGLRVEMGRGVQVSSTCLPMWEVRDKSDIDNFITFGLWYHIDTLSKAVSALKVRDGSERLLANEH